jgi:hypothetical protein
MKITKKTLTRLINEEIQNLQNEMMHADKQEAPAKNTPQQVLDGLLKKYETMLDDTGGYYNEKIITIAIEILRMHDEKDVPAKIDNDIADEIENKLVEYYSSGLIHGTQRYEL